MGTIYLFAFGEGWVSFLGSMGGGVLGVASGVGVDGSSGGMLSTRAQIIEADGGKQVAQEDP